MTKILIVPVGLELDRIVLSPQFVSVNEIYLITDKPGLKNDESDTTGKSKSLTDFTNQFCQDVKNIWAPIYQEKIHTKEIDITDQNEIIDVLSAIINDETEKSIATTFYINVSTSTKLFGIIACHVASFLPGRIIPFYLSTSHYIITELVNEDKIDERKQKISDFKKHGLTTGPYTLIEIPVLPIMKPKEIGITILEALMNQDTKGSPVNLEEILSLMKVSRENENYRIKTSFWAKKLRDLNFITMIKQGRDYRIQITNTGKLFYKLSKSLESLSH